MSAPSTIRRQDARRVIRAAKQRWHDNLPLKEQVTDILHGTADLLRNMERRAEARAKKKAR